MSLDTQIGGEHYKNLAIQPVQFSHANNLTFLEGCVVKRLCRHSRGGKGRQDIEKAIHELQLILELQYSPAPCYAGGWKPWDGISRTGPEELDATDMVEVRLANGNQRVDQKDYWMWGIPRHNDSRIVEYRRVE